MKPNSEKYQYLRLARRRFLAGTGCSSPERAVAKGQRSIEEWSRVVREELERQVKPASHSSKPVPAKSLENHSA